MGNGLVVHFSVHGSTARAARTIASLTGAEIVGIRPVVPYDADPRHYGALLARVRRERAAGARPELVDDIDPAGHDPIFLGYPLWDGAPPMPVCGFLEQHDLSGRRIAPFNTHGRRRRREPRHDRRPGARRDAPRGAVHPVRRRGGRRPRADRRMAPEAGPGLSRWAESAGRARLCAGPSGPRASRRARARATSRRPPEQCSARSRGRPHRPRPRARSPRSARRPPPRAAGRGPARSRPRQRNGPADPVRPGTGPLPEAFEQLLVGHEDPSPGTNGLERDWARQGSAHPRGAPSGRRPLRRSSGPIRPRRTR